jgi:hypothetical protein
MVVAKLMFCCVWDGDGGTLGEVKKAALGVDDEGGSLLCLGQGGECLIKAAEPFSVNAQDYATSALSWLRSSV